MNLFINRANTVHREMDEANNYPHYLLHKDEPVDFYLKYKDDSFAPENGKRSSRNLFDDSDVKDFYWFNIARKYFSKY